MFIDLYSGLTYEEDERIKNPQAYAHNGAGNRRCQHIDIRDKKTVMTILEKYELTSIADDFISFSVLWELPRREFAEDKMWVCLSGVTYNDKNFHPQHFVISNNQVTEDDQKKAMEILSYLSRIKNVKVSYPNK